MCFEPLGKRTEKTAPPFSGSVWFCDNDDSLQTSRVSFYTAPLNCLSGRTRALR